MKMRGGSRLAHHRGHSSQTMTSLRAGLLLALVGSTACASPAADTPPQADSSVSTGAGGAGGAGGDPSVGGDSSTSGVGGCLDVGSGSNEPLDPLCAGIYLLDMQK